MYLAFGDSQGLTFGHRKKLLQGIDKLKKDMESEKCKKDVSYRDNLEDAKKEV